MAAVLGPCLLVALSNKAQSSRRIHSLKKRAGSLKLALYTRAAAIDHYRARSNHARDLRISEAFEVLPKNPILWLFVSTIAAVKIMRNKRRLEASIESGGIECG